MKTFRFLLFSIKTPKNTLHYITLSAKREEKKIDFEKFFGKGKRGHRISNCAARTILRAMKAESVSALSWDFPPRRTPEAISFHALKVAPALEP